LEIDPDIELPIFDAEKSVGGVWCADRMYPGFVADSPVGLFDFSDLPMRDITGLKDWSDLPGYKVHDYLKAYCDKFSITERLRLGTKVSKVSRHEDRKRWDVKIEDSEEILTCDKLILATGLNSQPNWPDVPIENFTGLLIHSKDVGIHHEKLTSSKVNRVTVYGGCKSAIDTIILCLQAGKRVDWIIRETGNGPAMMLEVRRHGIHGAIFTGRFKNILTPSIFSTDSFWYGFLHSEKSKIGTWICSMVWNKASKTPLRMEPYKTKSSNIAKLSPETRE